MKIDSEVKTILGQIQLLRRRLKWLREHKKLLAGLPQGSMCGDSLDFDRLPHKEVIRVIRNLGGKWVKTANNHMAPAGGEIGQGIDYTASLDGMQVRCYAGAPPPSCRIVEVEEHVPERVIPAHTIKVKKMICTGKDDPLLVAMAQKVAPLNNNKPNGEIEL